VVLGVGELPPAPAGAPGALFPKEEGRHTCGVGAYLPPYLPAFFSFFHLCSLGAAVRPRAARTLGLSQCPLRLGEVWSFRSRHSPTQRCRRRGPSAARRRPAGASRCLSLPGPFRSPSGGACPFQKSKGACPLLTMSPPWRSSALGLANDRGRSTRSSLAHFGHPHKDFQR
jgi:hypothetical protein